jgi:addiction module HigA family antidote
MLPENRIPSHPAEVLEEDFLKPLRLTPSALAERMGIPLKQLYEILDGAQEITPEVAHLLAKELNTTPELWLNLQQVYQAYEDYVDIKAAQEALEEAQREGTISLEDLMRELDL